MKRMFQKMSSYETIYWHQFHQGNGIFATQKSLIEVGRQLITDHLSSIRGVLFTEEPREIVAYVKGLTPDELACFEETAKPEKVEYSRMKDNGIKWNRDFEGFYYNGRVYGLSAALQEADLSATYDEKDTMMRGYWQSTWFNGIWRNCLILTNCPKESTSDEDDDGTR